MTTQGPLAVTPEVGALLGQEWVYHSPDEIGKAAIRKYALAVGDDNPLYYDDDYARHSKYRGIISPPTLVCDTMQYMEGALDEVGGPINKPKLPLGAEIRGGNEYTFLRPLRPEDILTAHWKVSDIRERDGRSGKLVILVCEITYANQHGETLAVNAETTIFRVSGTQQSVSRSVGGAAGGDKAVPKEGEVRRLETPLYFDEVQPGCEIAPLRKEITLPQMVFYAAATWDFHRYHYDHEFVREQGFPMPFVDGQVLGAFLAQMLTDWAGDPGAISQLGFRFREFAFPGDSLLCKGQVVGKLRQEGRNTVECELTIENQEGNLVLDRGHATLTLPSTEA